MKVMVRVPAKEAEKINFLLSHTPASSKECFGEDSTITHTADFGGGVEMDIKLCGVQYREGEDNTPWTEAVLFVNGAEACCSEPAEDYFGEWSLEYGGNTYTADVVEEKEGRELTYYIPEFDFNDTADQLFVQARNGYIESAPALQKLEEILRSPWEGKTDKANYVHVLLEYAEDDGKDPWILARFKKDILDGCGSEDVMIGDTYTLSVVNDRGHVIASVLEAPSEEFPYGRTGAAAVDTDAFMAYTAEDFRNLVNSVIYYQMDGEPADRS